MLFIGSPLIRSLKKLKGAKWAPREDTPDSHSQKAGVPSMGGIGIIGSTFLFWILFAAVTLFLSFAYTKATGGNADDLFSLYFITFFLPSVFPLVIWGHAILGYIDDLSKARSRGGISSKAKLLGQILLAGAFLISFPITAHWIDLLGFTPTFHLIIKSWWMWPLALLVIIGTSNAVNLTDGIDGLAASLSVQVAFAFFILGMGQPRENWYIVTVFWMALGGACLGFLAFNKHPARVFMGDTGSLALGAALGAGAIVTGTVWLLPFVGFIFYVEMFSVIAQVLYFKYTRRKFGEGKRLFRRAPLHHHFELSGWSEWRVVATFWGVNLITTIIGLVLWKMGILPRFP